MLLSSEFQLFQADRKCLFSDTLVVYGELCSKENAIILVGVHIRLSAVDNNTVGIRMEEVIKKLRVFKYFS
jgi:hypothetical protein